MIDWEQGLLNAIGLTNPGVDEEIKLLRETKQLLMPLNVPLIASIFAGSVDEFGKVASLITSAEPDLIEVNISCPNVHDDFGLPFAADYHSAEKVTRAVKRAVGDIPITIKLAPNVSDLGRIAKAVEGAGADMITAINTMPGMVIDVDAGQAVLNNRTGGISGPALKPIALRCVAEIAQNVNVPIIGTGGVMTGRDAIAMLMAGATAVGVGSALWYRGPDAFKLIKREMEEFMREKGLQRVSDLIGVALK
jgi:dihydroorotate dehydrogenase (NAD+) catalytic subunit